MSERENFWERLNAAMERQGVGLPQTCAGVGVALSTGYRWAEGSRPQSRTIQALAHYLRVREAWLASGDGEMLENPKDKGGARPVQYQGADEKLAPVLQEMDAYSLTAEDLRMYNNLLLLRTEITHCLDRAVTTPSDKLEAQLQAAARRYTEQCRKLRPVAAEAIRERLCSIP